MVVRKHIVLITHGGRADRPDLRHRRPAIILPVVLAVDGDQPEPSEVVLDDPSHAWHCHAGRIWVANDVAERALEELGEEEGIDPSASIHRVAAKKWKALAQLDDFTRRRRLYAFLARRGFNPDEIRSAMDVLGAEGDA